MNNRILLALTAILLLSGCSESSDETSRYGRESLRHLDKDCVKRSLEARMQQAADYSESRLNALRGDASAPNTPQAGAPDVPTGLLDNCYEDAGTGK